jgi:hypothetical protein
MEAAARRSAGATTAVPPAAARVPAGLGPASGVAAEAGAKTVEHTLTSSNERKDSGMSILRSQA